MSNKSVNKQPAILSRDHDLDLSIIIVNWNTRDILHECLSSTFEGLGDVNTEVIVVDNASTDGSVEMVRSEFPDAQLIANTENVGFAATRRRAALRLSL